MKLRFAVVVFATLANIFSSVVASSDATALSVVNAKTKTISDNTSNNNNNDQHHPNARRASKQGLRDAAATTAIPVRGGVSFKVEKTLPKTLAGVAVLAAIEQVMKRVLKELDIKFPPMLAGCLALFGSLLVMDSVKPSMAAKAADFLAPGAAFLTKWLPMFFVPGLALLPLAPSVGGGLEILKLMSVVILGLVYTIITVGATVLSLQGKGQLKFGAKKLPSPKKVARKFGFGGGKNKPAATAAATSAKPFTQNQVQMFAIAAAVTAVMTVVSSKGEFHKFFETCFLTFFTVASYMWSARLPSSFVSVVHPLVTTCCLILTMVQIMAVTNNVSFNSLLRGYKVGSLHWKKAGSGDVLLYLLGPAAVSFAISMFGKRALLSKNLMVVATAVLVSSVGGLFGTAAFVRAIQLGGKSINARTVRLSVLSRNVTTALALALTSMIGGNLAMCAAVVCLTGVMGATYGKAILGYFGITDPITRGLCIGSSAQGLGVASMADESDAFPFAAMAMVLTAVTSTTLVTFPSVKQALVKLATGSKI